ncbi:Imm44 family immunity protein [Flavobacterium sp. FlaQc-47]|uniref:Imm44 family immunity protein n=1 Tax=Flavobacterium sp. FlaQc-47 TaxID=3374180 RepID=UPI0037566BBE
MKFALALYTSAEIKKETRFLVHFSDDLEKSFNNKKYGNDLMEIVIICVSPVFEQFFKPRKPKYTKDKKHVKSEGFEYNIEKCLEFDLKLDFEIFKNSTEIEAKRYLSLEILKSLETIESMKSKIKDFDLLAFRKDLENYFSLIEC